MLADRSDVGFVEPLRNPDKTFVRFDDNMFFHRLAVILNDGFAEQVLAISGKGNHPPGETGTDHGDGYGGENPKILFSTTNHEIRKDRQVVTSGKPTTDEHDERR